MSDYHNHQKKIALINDMTGFGRCSIAVALPVISMLRVQCCALPTAIFSNHTGFESFYYQDYTDHMQPSINEWKKLGLEFSGICTGFLGSARQIAIVSDFIRDFKRPDNLVIIDPVMGDYGKPYPTYTKEMCDHMKDLVCYADILTPNMTEACILTDTPYEDKKWHLSEIEAMAARLSENGPSKIVITGITQGQYVANFCYEPASHPEYSEPTGLVHPAQVPATSLQRSLLPMPLIAFLSTTRLKRHPTSSKSVSSAPLNLTFH